MKCKYIYYIVRAAVNEASASRRCYRWRQSVITPTGRAASATPFRYPHYHDATDTPEQLDYTGMARVTSGLADVIAVLASK